MTRISQHSARARVYQSTGAVIDVGEITAQLNLDEALSPYGHASVTYALTPEALTGTDPLTHPGSRLLLEMRETTGDPVILSEITAAYGPGADLVALSEITAAYGPGADLVALSEITAAYFVPWNAGDVRPGTAIRANLAIIGRRVDYARAEITLEAATDEALLSAYRLLSTVSVTSGSLMVRATVNFALSRIGAALLPGPDDAPIVDAEGIIWDPGTSGWDYARNVAEAAGLVVRCDERRRWTLTSRGAVRTESVALSSFTAADEGVDLDSDLWADAVVVRYAWTEAATNDAKVRYDTASLSGDPVKVVTVERQTRYPGPGAARYWLNRLKARGRVFRLESVADYTLRPGMGFSASIPSGPTTVGYLEALTWDAPSDRGAIRTRGAADATGNAIDLWPISVMIDALVGSINDQTITEV